MSRHFGGMTEDTARRLIAELAKAEARPEPIWTFPGDVERLPPPGGLQWIKFELKDPLEPAVLNTTDAYRVNWNPLGAAGAGSWDTDIADIFEVETPERKHWGITGEQGWCVARGIGGGGDVLYDIMINPGSPHYHGELTAELGIADSESVDVHTGDPLVDSGDNLTVVSSPLQGSAVPANDMIRFACFPEEGALFKITGAECT